MNKYVLVHFLELNNYEVVPVNWIQKKGNVIF